MAKRNSKEALKRREAERRRKVVSRKAQVRIATRGGRPTHASAGFAMDQAIPPKLSAVVLDYARPLTEKADDLLREKNAIRFAIISWNASLLSLEKARETVVPILEELAGDDQQIKSDMLGMFAMMYRHKKLHYAQDRRFIVDFSLTDIDEGIYLEVASTPLPA